MKASCVLCDQPYAPSPMQEKKLRKHPHRIFLCSGCHRRITERTRARKGKQDSQRPGAQA